MNHFHKYFDQIDAHIIIFKHNKIESIYQKLDILNMKNVQMTNNIEIYEFLAL